MIYDTTRKLVDLLKLIRQDGSLQVFEDFGEQPREVPLKLLNEETQIYRRESVKGSGSVNYNLSCTCDWCKIKLKRAEAMEGRDYYD